MRILYGEGIERRITQYVYVETEVLLGCDV